MWTSIGVGIMTTSLKRDLLRPEEIELVTITNPRRQRSSTCRV
ncbi:hypothetical protein QJQ58_27760 [Paenibacillus dendritiformis]|nr:hypothetical protein [Paenibacillus dendritiformis]WGU94247.1 hypothetical protein QJQ58_27760 [Paenibacillus dendritiformis]